MLYIYVYSLTLSNTQSDESHCHHRLNLSRHPQCASEHSMVSESERRPEQDKPTRHKNGETHVELKHERIDVGARHSFRLDENVAASEE